MASTFDSLVGAQAAIESLFSRPVSRKPTRMDPALVATFVSSSAYHWGLDNLVGIAVPWPQTPEVQLYLAEKPVAEFRKSLAALLPTIPLRFWITGKFQFAAGVGGDISLHGKPEIGTIALFLQDGKGQDYALTCAHVLDGKPAQRPRVDNGNAKIGELTELVDLQYGCNAGNGATANQVDCALAQLDKNVSRSNSLGGGGSITGIESAVQNQPITIITSSALIGGTVSNTNTNACIYDVSERRFAYFQNLIAVTGAADVGGGDSGSVVLSADNFALGMVISFSSSGVVLACDMQTVVNALQPRVTQIVPGAILTLI